MKRHVPPTSQAFSVSFRVSFSTKGSSPWCTYPGVPEVLIESLRLVRDVCGGRLFAFCILPTRLSIVLEPGASGLAHVVESFRHASTGLLLTPPLCSGWEEGCCDERLPDPSDRARAMYEVEQAAVRQGLVSDIAEWPWTSLRYQDVVDRFAEAEAK